MTEQQKPTIYIGADHRGFNLKAQITPWLRQQGYQVQDLGNTQLDLEDDFPKFSLAVAEQVAADPNQRRGLVICGSGVGAVIAANKVKNARASHATTTEMAQQGRHDDDMNVLVIAADFQNLDQLQPIITTFLETSYAAEPKYERRLAAITNYETQAQA